MPQVRRDIHNVIIPLDLTDVKDIELLVEPLQTFVKRKIPIRFGIVPMTNSAAAVDQAKIVYHLLDTYGLSAVFAYLEAVGCPSSIIWFQLLTGNSQQLARGFRSPKKPILIPPSRIEALAEIKMYLTSRLFLTRRGPNLEFKVQSSTSNDLERMRLLRRSSLMEWRCLEMRRGYRP